MVVLQQYSGMSVDIKVCLLLIFIVQGPLIVTFESVAHSFLQGYYRAAKACQEQGNRSKAIEYLKDGIEKCSNSNTEDLRNLLQIWCEDRFSRMYSNSSSYL